MIEEFRDNDKEYQKWLSENPNGFVVNTQRNCSSDYMVLHRSTCFLICKYTDIARPVGGFTERQYIKICSSSIDELKDHIKDRYGANNFSKICSRCNP